MSESRLVPKVNDPIRRAHDRVPILLFLERPTFVRKCPELFAKQRLLIIDASTRCSDRAIERKRIWAVLMVAVQELMAAYFKFCHHRANDFPVI
ncbi:MAG: hypothetical protein PHD04_03230 [Candidatus Pacebacteria bacterium]|nr:hypothetical protein [Candidatus Paceibacterota bacterium]